MAITALPIPPSRNDPENFSVRGDAFLSALPLFQEEANELQEDVNEKQTLAAASQAAASASEIAAASTSGVIIWVTGTTYAVGDNRFDPVDFKTYRRKVAGAGSTRPGLDGTNWQLLTSLGDVTLAGDQTLTGIKTFSQTIVGTIQNANVAAALSDSTSLVPSGTVLYTARATTPSGWLKANGTAVSRTTYSTLFTAIGTTFGGGDGSTTFNVPDLRGEFVRGHDDGRGIDSGRVYGSFQSDAIRNITGTITGLQYPTSQSGAFAAGGAEGNKAPGADTPGSTATFDASRVVPTASENRPRNVALLAIIKY